MVIPDGYSEEEVFKAIETIQKSLSGPFSFGYYDPEDISQEIWMEANNLLSKQKYNKEEGELGGYLYRHIKRRLLNLWRNKYRRPGGLKNKRWEHNKKSLMNPLPIEEYSESLLVFDKDIDLSVVERMPFHLQNDFYREAHGVKVTQNRKRAVRTHLRGNENQA